MDDAALRCPLCGNAKVTLLGRRSCLGPIDGYAPYVDDLALYDRNVFRCLVCGLQFIDPMYLDADLSSLYGHEKYEQFLNTAEVMSDLQSKAARAFLKRLAVGLIEEGVDSWREQFEARHSRSPRFLDVGCGRGGHLWAFDNIGFRVSGIDMSEKHVAFVREQMQFDVQHTSLEDFQPEEPFDCILASHVIEHTSCPHGFMDDALRLLADDGLLILHTPLTNDYGREDHRYRDIYHTLFFDHFTLTLLAAMHGMRCIHMSNAFFWRGCNIVHIAGLFVRDKDLIGQSFTPLVIRTFRNPYEGAHEDLLMLIRDHLQTHRPGLVKRTWAFFRKHGTVPTIKEIMRTLLGALVHNARSQYK